MIRSGLVSITFRQLSVERIVELVAGAGLDGIEWGGDVHVPHGDLSRARDVRVLCERAGLAVAAYGSYYHLGAGEAFDGVLGVACELAAPTVRVWAGEKGSADADAAYRERIADESRALAAAAAREGTVVAFEFHGGTLTDTPASALSLLAGAGCDSLRCYWQPVVEESAAANVGALRALAGHLANVHVFHWDGGRRCALAEGQDNWRQYLPEIEAAGGDRFAMLEFVRDDEPAAFAEDAATLKQWLAQLQARRG
jgi:sugar phosphate isomerase/epimerase